MPFCLVIGGAIGFALYKEAEQVRAAVRQGSVGRIRRALGHRRIPVRLFGALVPTGSPRTNTKKQVARTTWCGASPAYFDPIGTRRRSRRSNGHRPRRCRGPPPAALGTAARAAARLPPPAQWSPPPPPPGPPPDRPRRPGRRPRTSAAATSCLGAEHASPLSGTCRPQRRRERTISAACGQPFGELGRETCVTGAIGVGEAEAVDADVRRDRPGVRRPVPRAVPRPRTASRSDSRARARKPPTARRKRARGRTPIGRSSVARAT